MSINAFILCSWLWIWCDFSGSHLEFAVVMDSNLESWSKLNSQINPPSVASCQVTFTATEMKVGQPFGVWWWGKDGYIRPLSFSLFQQGISHMSTVKVLLHHVYSALSSLNFLNVFKSTHTKFAVCLSITERVFWFCGESSTEISTEQKFIDLPLVGASAFT